MTRHSSPTPCEVVILDEEVRLTLTEVGRLTGLGARALVRMIDEGVLEPHAGAEGDWRFPASALVRLRVARRLQSDLGVNLAGAALALDLIEELRRLRQRVDTLEAMLEADFDL